MHPQQRHRSSSCKVYAASNKVTDAGWEGIAGSFGVGLIWAGLACEYPAAYTLYVLAHHVQPAMAHPHAWQYWS